MRLVEALRIQSGHPAGALEPQGGQAGTGSGNLSGTYAVGCVAFAGAGGKTTAMLQVARELGGRVFITTTTHLGKWQLGLADRHVVVDTATLHPSAIPREDGITVFTGPLSGNRATAPAPVALEYLRSASQEQAIPLLIEADGAHGRLLKAPAAHEPAIPGFSDHVVVLAGISAVGRPNSAEFVHRPDFLGRIAGIAPGELITLPGFVRVLTDPDGGLKNLPPTARRILLLNQADTAELQAAALRAVPALLRHYHAVVVASLGSPASGAVYTEAQHAADAPQGLVLAVHERIAGIVLAAGASTRYGQPKQLLDWHGQPFVRHVALVALQAGLEPVVVVLGSHAGPIRAAVEDLDIDIVDNSEWSQGQASSVRAGLGRLSILNAKGTTLPDDLPGGAVFLLADQPQINADLIRALASRHSAGLFPIVAPLVPGGRRANPILFDRSTFSDLLELEGEAGGRAIFSRHPIEYIPWHDERLLLDVDHPEDYRKLLGHFAE